MNMSRLFRRHLVQPWSGRTFYTAILKGKEVADNPFYDKYKSKLEMAQGDLPLVETKDDAKKSAVSPRPSASNTRAASFSRPPDLNILMKVDLIVDKSSDEITKIWVEHHKTKDCISAVMPSPSFLQLHTKSLHCPMFVYPLPREEGYEMWFSQFSGQRCYFTSLVNYQKFQDNAPISFTITHYTEFMESKGIVLVHGEVDTTVLSTLEAQNMTNQMHLYYASNDPKYYTMVQQFNHNPQEFDYEMLIHHSHCTG